MLTAYEVSNNGARPKPVNFMRRVQQTSEGRLKISFAFVMNPDASVYYVCEIAVKKLLDSLFLHLEEVANKKPKEYRKEIFQCIQTVQGLLNRLVNVQMQGIAAWYDQDGGAMDFQE